MKALEVGVAASDDSGRLVAATGLDHVDGVQLQTATDSNRPSAQQTESQPAPGEWERGSCDQRSWPPLFVVLTTYFEEPSCITLASVTSNNKSSSSRLPEGTGLPPSSRHKFLQLSWSCRVSRAEGEGPTGEAPTGLASMKVEPKVSRVKSQQHFKLGKTLELDRRLNRDQRPAQIPNLLSINSNVLLTDLEFFGLCEPGETLLSCLRRAPPHLCCWAPPPSTLPGSRSHCRAPRHRHFPPGLLLLLLRCRRTESPQGDQSHTPPPPPVPPPTGPHQTPPLPACLLLPVPFLPSERLWTASVSDDPAAGTPWGYLAGGGCSSWRREREGPFTNCLIMWLITWRISSGVEWFGKEMIWT